MLVSPEVILNSLSVPRGARPQDRRRGTNVAQEATGGEGEIPREAARAPEEVGGGEDAEDRDVGQGSRRVQGEDESRDSYRRTRRVKDQER